MVHGSQALILGPNRRQNHDCWLTKLEGDDCDSKETNPQLCMTQHGSLVGFMQKAPESNTACSRLAKMISAGACRLLLASLLSRIRRILI